MTVIEENNAYGKDGILILFTLSLRVEKDCLSLLYAYNLANEKSKYIHDYKCSFSNRHAVKQQDLVLYTYMYDMGKYIIIGNPSWAIMEDNHS